MSKQTNNIVANKICVVSKIGLGTGIFGKMAVKGLITTAAVYILVRPEGVVGGVDDGSCCTGRLVGDGGQGVVEVGGVSQSGADAERYRYACWLARRGDGYQCGGFLVVIITYKSNLHPSRIPAWPGEKALSITNTTQI